METDAHQSMLEKAADLSLEGKDEAARAIYKELSDKGSWYADVQLGYLNLVGKGGAKDVDRAEELFLKASNSGSSLGKYYLALCYQETNRKEKAFKEIKELTDQGYIPAINRLGWMYELGEGCEINLLAAQHYRNYAARFGHLFAQRWVAEQRLWGREGIWKIPVGAVAFVVSNLKIFWIALFAPTDVRVQR